MSVTTVDTTGAGIPQPADTTTAAVVAGLAAGVAFAAVLEADVRLTGNNVDDILVLGRLVVRDRKRARSIGYGLHLDNSVALALVYARLQPRLPGPPWARGTLFALAENTILYPITLLEGRHPAVRDGSVDSYRTWPAFIQSLPRHVAYGAVLGSLYYRLTRTSRRRTISP